MGTPENTLLLLDPDDNVLVALRAIGPGPARTGEGHGLMLRDAVSMGHKLARRDIAPGEKILKYGVSIGSATEAIPAGAHVHVHNMKSDYTATHSLMETAGGHTDG